MAMEIQKSSEETIALISEASKVNNDFTVRILRRRNPSALAETVAVLAGAQLEHFIIGPRTPELWLPKLSGGGLHYLLTVYSSSNSERPIGGPLIIQVPGEPRIANPDVLDDPDWVGPAKCIVPEKIVPVQQQAQQIHISSPPLPPGKQLPSATNDVQVSSLPGGISLAAAESMQKQWDEILRARTDLAEERRKVEVAAARREGESQLAAVKAEAEARSRLERERADRMERELAEIRARPAVVAAPPQNDRLAELLLEQRKSEAEQRLADRAAEREQRAAEVAQRAAERAADRESQLALERIRAEAKIEADKLQARMFEMAASKPSGSEAAEKVFASMATGLSGLMSNQINMLSAMNDLGLNGQQEVEAEPEPKWIKAVERMVRAFGPAIQQRVVQPQPTTQPQRQVAAPRPQQRPRPVTVQQQPVTPEVMPPEAAMGAPPPVQEGEVVDVVEEIFDTIRERAMPSGQIADMMMANMLDPGLQAVLQESTDLKEILENHLGMDWLTSESNRMFAKSVAVDFVERAVRGGIFPAAMLEEIAGELEGLGMKR